MSFANFVRGFVKRHPELKLKLKKANSRLSPFQYMYQTLSMTALSVSAFFIIVFMVTKSNILNMILGFGIVIMLIPFFYKFWLSYVDVQIRKYGRELDADILFVSEYFLVSLNILLKYASNL